MLHESLRVDKKIRAFYEKYERLLVPGLLVMGFIFDVITFQTLPMKSNLQFQGAYLILAALALIYSYTYDGRRTPSQWTILRYLRAFAPYVVQLTFGSLLGSALLFYWFSGAFSVSWPIIAITTGVMISSELFRGVYSKPQIQFSVYTFVLLSYLAVLLPFLLNSLSGWMFILSGLISSLVSLSLIACLTGLSPAIARQRVTLFMSVLGVFVVMSVFYVFNIIPPIPLSIREAGVYHNLVRKDDELILVGEDETFWQGLWPGQTIHTGLTDSVYVYTAIFAPTRLKTTIFHRWEYYNPDTKQWEDVSLLHFSIRGGRIEGYRGYTMKSDLEYGRWRVSVQNERGQVLGRVAFRLAAP